MKISSFDPSQQHGDTDGKIIAALERLAQVYKTMLWSESKAHALTPIQIQLLIFLLYHEAEMRTVSYLAEEFGLTKPTISDTVRLLETKGFLNRETHPQDARSQYLILTPEGRRTARKTARFAETLREPLSHLPSTDKSSLLQSLLAILRDVHDSGQLSHARMCLTCLHYRRGGSTGHACQLLGIELPPDALRLDCPEHMTGSPDRSTR